MSESTPGRERRTGEAANPADSLIAGVDVDTRSLVVHLDQNSSFSMRAAMRVRAGDPSGALQYAARAAAKNCSSAKSSSRRSKPSRNNVYAASRAPSSSASSHAQDRVRGRALRPRTTPRPRRHEGRQRPTVRAPQDTSSPTAPASPRLPRARQAPRRAACELARGSAAMSTNAFTWPAQSLPSMHCAACRLAISSGPCGPDRGQRLGRSARRQSVRAPAPHRPESGRRASQPQRWCRPRMRRAVRRALR